MGFSRQEHWSGFPCLSPGGLPDPGTKPTSLTSPVLAGGSLLLVTPEEPLLQAHTVSYENSKVFVYLGLLRGEKKNRRKDVKIQLLKGAEEV